MILAAAILEEHSLPFIKQVQCFVLLTVFFTSCASPALSQCSNCYKAAGSIVVSAHIACTCVRQCCTVAIVTAYILLATLYIIHAVMEAYA